MSHEWDSLVNDADGAPTEVRAEVRRVHGADGEGERGCAASAAHPFQPQGRGSQAGLALSPTSKLRRASFVPSAQIV